MLSRKMKILTCFCPDCQRLNVNQLYYILVQTTFIPKFKSPETVRLPNMIRSYYSSMRKEQINVKCNEILLKLKLKQRDIDNV